MNYKCVYVIYHVDLKSVVARYLYEDECIDAYEKLDEEFKKKVDWRAINLDYVVEILT